VIWSMQEPYTRPVRTVLWEGWGASLTLLDISVTHP